MKYVRCTGYLIGAEPMTIVAALDGLTVDTAAEYKQHMVAQIPVAYIVVDAFSTADDDEGATVVAMERWANTREEEAEAATLHAWLTSVLPNAIQCINVPVASSLGIERLTDVLEQVSQHPDYRSQLVQCYVQDDNTLTEVAMKDGAVTTEERSTRT